MDTPTFMPVTLKPEDFRTESSVPVAYRLILKRVEGLTLQGYYTWQSLKGYGGEWRDIPTEVE